MNGTTLRSSFLSFLPAAEIGRLAAVFDVEKRSRKRDLGALVTALVLVSGSDDSGRQADAYSAYLAEAEHEVVRSSFYEWFTEELALLMTALLRRALDIVLDEPPLLTGALSGVRDWWAVDSETVTLLDPLADEFPATSTLAGLKIHKVYSLGLNNMVDFKITPAREHDGPHLQVDESWRGLGLLVDLGYASFRLIGQCRRHGVSLVLRLKDDWKPRMLRFVDEEGEVTTLEGEPVTENLLEMRTLDFDGSSFDFDVVFGKGEKRVEARLIGVPGPETYHWYITTLPRSTHTPVHVGQLYRTRWEIELDNRRDKGAARLDQIRATTVSSVIVLIHAALLRTVIANHLVHLDLRDRDDRRPPLHAFAVAITLSTNWLAIVIAMELDDSRRWERLARRIRARGHDPNWRRRPSQLDRLRGTTAPPGRPRSALQKDCEPGAFPFTTAPVAAAM
jgi:putative transposase